MSSILTNLCSFWKLMIGLLNFAISQSQAQEDLSQVEVTTVSSPESDAIWCPTHKVGNQCPEETLLSFYKCCGHLNKECCFHMRVWVVIMIIVLPICLVLPATTFLIRRLLCSSREETPRGGVPSAADRVRQLAAEDSTTYRRDSDDMTTQQNDLVLENVVIPFASSVFKDTRFANLWRGEISGEESCGRCSESEGKLRICVDCNGADAPDPFKCLWINNGKVEKRADRKTNIRQKWLAYKEFHKDIINESNVKERIAEFRQLLEDDLLNFEASGRKLVLVPPESEPSSPTFQNCKYRILFFPGRNPLSLLKLNLLCSECTLKHREEKPGHKAIKLEDIDFWKEDVRRATANYAGMFLWKNMHREAGNLCKLRSMRLLRTCEALIHWSCLHYPFTTTQNFKPIGIKDDHNWTHRRAKSRVSKYFESLDFDQKPDKNVIQLLIDSLEAQLRELKKISGKCECTEKYETLKRAKLGNQVEKAYLEMINNKALHETIENCPLKWLESSGNLKNLDEQETYWMSKNCKIYRFPSIFCWNPRYQGSCHVFDKETRKPCICPICFIPTCLDCLKSTFSLSCPHCGCGFQRGEQKGTIRREAMYKFDEEIMELVDSCKQDPLEFYKDWWAAEVAPGEGFCLQCYSYTSQLEICHFCELSGKENVILQTKNGFEFNSAKMHQFPGKWQCCECTQRLDAQWRHSTCENKSADSKKFDSTLNRGCNHPRRRLENNCPSDWRCAKSIVSLKTLRNSEMLWKASTWHIAKEVLNDQSMDVEAQKILGNLEIATFHYFQESFGPEVEDKDTQLKKKAEEIENLIDLLRLRPVETK